MWRNAGIFADALRIEEERPNLYGHKEYRRGVYLNLLTSGRLNDYLADIEEQAQKRFERIVEQMAESEGITEQLKATDQVAWVVEMNNIWSRAREVVNAELIYN